MQEELRCEAEMRLAVPLPSVWNGMLPSGNLLHSYWTWPSRNSWFTHQKHGDFPSFFVNVYQAGYLPQLFHLWAWFVDFFWTLMVKSYTSVHCFFWWDSIFSSLHQPVGKLECFLGSKVLLKHSSYSNLVVPQYETIRSWVDHMYTSIA